MTTTSGTDIIWRTYFCLLLSVRHMIKTNYFFVALETVAIEAVWNMTPPTLRAGVISPPFRC